nr:ATP-binding cassette domain-containing protein [Phenylobacterium sp. J426]
MIEVSHVSKAFGANQVLRDVSFEVARGEVVCLIGPSGSGKSTVLRCINGLERHDGGVIRVDGVEVGAATLPQVRGKLAMVFQRFNLFPHRTVLDNVMEGPIHAQGRARAEVSAEARELLGKVGVADKADALPSSLSGGSSSGSGSPARWPCARRPSCSTSRHRRSTRSASATCCGSCATWRTRA